MRFYFYLQQNLYHFIVWSSQCHHYRRRSSWTLAVRGVDDPILRPTATWLSPLQHLFVILWLSHYNDSVILLTFPTQPKVCVACRKAWCKLIWLFFSLLIFRSDNNQKLEAASTRQNHRQHADLGQWNSRRIDLKCDTKNYNNTYEAHAAGGNKRQTLEAVDPTISHRLAIDWMSIRWGKL